MKRKNYKLPSNIKQGLFALALTLFSDKVYSQTTYTFNYTGGAQTLAIQPGNYEIECWGANGGWGGTTTALTGTGGIGGYSKGIYAVASPTTLYIYVGGVGQSTNTTGAAFVSAAGGWNGGGGGRSGSSNSYYRGGGGGGTDVRTTQNTIYSDRIIVAGGGGGAGGSSGTPSTWVGSGGNGGGTSGQDGVLAGSQTNHNGKGGTQGAGGQGGVYSTNIGVAGSFGLGGDGGGNGNAFPAGGGGGGWYGGGGGSTQGGGGGGGSGYIGGVTSGTTAQSGQTGFVPNPVTTGNGLVIIRELCNITLTANGVNANGAICAGASVTLTTNAVSNYSWNTNQTTSSIVVAPSVTAQYSLTATSSSNCIGSAAITITVDSAAPSLTVNNTANSGGICPGTTVNITASGATTYTWTGGSPTLTNGVTFAPTSGGTYSVSGSNACGTTAAVTSVSIHPAPIVGASASTSTLCSGASLTLTATGNYTNHSWAGGYSSGIGFFPSVTNTYVVTGTSALSCTNSAAVIVTVVTTPALAPTYPSLICFGQTATLTASGATNYTWLPVAGSASAAPSVTVSPAVTTTYTVIKANANCVDTKTFVLNVNALPGVFAIVTPTVICALKTATLFGGGALTFTWSAPPSFSATGSSPIVAPLVPTTYTVTGSDGICTNTTSVILTVDPNPTLSASASPSAVCLGQTTTLTALGGVNYTWSATTGTAYTATHTDNPTQPTLYTLTGDNSFGCTSSVNQIVLVNQLPPMAVAANKTLVCIAGDAKLTASGANSYLWDQGAGSAITPTVMVNPLTTTTYTVEGTSTTTGCKNQKSITITVFEPSVAVTNPTSTCFGGNINIVASGATSYTWHLGNGVTHIFATAAVTPTVFTIYTVTALTSTIGGLSCPSTNTTSVDIFYNPTITASPQRPSICKNESVQLYGTGGDTYFWNDPQSQTGATITVSPQLQTTYTVVGTDSHGCVSTGTVLVKVSPCVGISEFNGSGSKITFYPNPNNGEFVIQSDITITLTLSNDLGQVIKTIDISEPSTKIEMNDLAKGVYFISGQKGVVKVYEKMIVIK